ncbi:MAG: hypothetical protein ABMA64_40350 [Myxococcota bacterium]
MILELFAAGGARPAEIDRDTFLARRADDAAAALAAAESALSGDPTPAAERAGVVPELIRRLVDRPPAVPGPGLAAVLGPPEVLPPLGGVRAEPRWREWAWAAAAPAVTDTTHGRVAWAIDALAYLQREVDRRQRAPWAAVRFSPSDRDPGTARAWTGWAERPWDVREAWERTWLPWLMRAANAVLRARRVPEPVREVIREDLREAFFFVLLGSGALAGWRELAVRVLETGGSRGPIDALARLLGPADWARLGAGAVRRGRWARTLALALPDVVANARGAAAARACLADPGAAERWVDLHVATRAVASWRDPARTRPDRTWEVVTQNRGRVRSRLRAVLGERADLAELVARAPAVHARTTQAVLRYGRDLTWNQIARGFSFDAGARLDPPCDEPAPEVSRELRAWVLLCVLKGRADHLERWVATGTTGDRDSTWGRLLQDLPAPLRGPGLPELRTTLSTQLAAVLAELGPTIVRLANIDGVSAAQSFEQALEEVWDPCIPRPRVRYAAYAAAARTFLTTRSHR